MIIHTIPASLPSTMQRVVDELRETKSQKECLRAAYDLLTEKYCGNRMKTLTHFSELFPSSVNEVWARNGFLHCTNQNWLLAILLIKSGHFAPQDIHTRWT